jgi:NADP-dependent 3-hydroxy acid dehydrogenase YdfG
MADRTALVVGASSAIGRAVTRGLADDGFDCLAWGRDPERLAAAGPRWDVVDLRSAEDVRAGIERLPGRLSAVVYAAGLFDWAPADVGDPDVWDELVTVNLSAAMRVTRGVLPALLAGAPSSLVLVGSGAARTAFPNNPAYVASKHGLAGFARSVFLDVRDRDVAVTLLSPGLVAAGAGCSRACRRSCCSSRRTSPTPRGGWSGPHRRCARSRSNCSRNGPPDRRVLREGSG